MKIHDWQNTYWKDSKGNKTSIKIINFLLKDDPVVSLELGDLTHVPSVIIEEFRKETADLSCPIIVVEKDGNFQYILDGHHRRQKALDENRTYILAKIFRGEVIND
jgi:hypothetical protein